MSVSCVFRSRRRGSILRLFPIFTLLGALAAPPAATSALQDTAREAAVRRHVRAIEGATGGTLDEALTRFERDHFSRAYLARVAPADRRDVVAVVRAAVADVDDVRVMVRDGRYEIMLGGRVPHQVTFTLETAEPFGIDSLEVARTAAAPVAALEITRENLVATFDRLEKEGLSGVVSVRLDGKVVLERPFGLANATMGLPMRLDTIFGTGSRPIDYTVASIFLLEQAGALELDDTIGRLFGAAVPPDKRSMTVRHLMDGQSGLPDFFHTPDDWNPDLAWIDRTTAEHRILAQPLRFAPGADRAHSHAGFGLLAAIVERASGQSYAEFVRQRLLEPAGMTRTGFYGESLGLPLAEFAVGGGPESVGVPNIPPNWGPTSWLVMGSGGMFSTLGDLQRFYTFIRSGAVLADRHGRRFRGPFATRDGSDRGFELFHVHNPAGHEVMLLLNVRGGRPGVRQVFDGLARLVQPDARPN